MQTEPDWVGKPSNPNGIIDINSNTIIRELVIINKPVYEKTYIGSNCYLMNRSYVGHDSHIGDNVTLYPGSSVCGFVKIGDYSKIGVNASIHQNATIGRCCMIGGGSFFKGTSPDGITWGGVPAKPLKVNYIGIENSNLSDTEKMEIIRNAESYLTSNCHIDC
jgi:UDP-N-acetylglucosamine acyltransferase